MTFSVFPAGLRTVLAGTNPSSLGKNVDIKEKFVAAGCHNYRTGTVPIPLALLHKPLAEFLDNLEHIELSERDMLFTVDVCRKMRQHFALEKPRESEFAQLFREYVAFEGCHLAHRHSEYSRKIQN